MLSIACFFVALACVVYICKALPALGRFVGYTLLAIVGAFIGWLIGGWWLGEPLAMMVAPLACAYLLPMAVWFFKRRADHGTHKHSH